jgi:hypothetical protein
LKNTLRFQSIGKIGMHSLSLDHRAYEISDRVNEGMFVADEVAGRPPVCDEWM